MPHELRPAAFIDRDGVINAELGYVHRVEDFRLLPRVAEGLRGLQQCGYELVIVTNQAGIARGLYGEPEYQHFTRHMLEVLAAQGVRPSAVYHCPHHPDGTIERYAIHCNCRKPAPGMLQRAAVELGLDLARSVMIGDKTSDTAAGRRAGVCSTVLVASGHALPGDVAQHADYCCKDLLAAADWLRAKSGLGSILG
jgi:D-glycero-D-manno-heptose 1,7-bisphosphate phosphatase